MRGRSFRAAVVAVAIGAVTSWAGGASASAVSTHEEGTGPRITSPIPQSGVTQGEAVEVAGDGCPPGAAVSIEFNDEAIASTQADAEGAFGGSFTVPTVPIPDDLEEAGEASVAVVCGDQRATVVVAVSPAARDAAEPTSPVTDAPATGDLDTLPETGSGATAALSALGLGLLGAGAVLVRRARVHGARGAR